MRQCSPAGSSDRRQKSRKGIGQPFRQFPRRCQTVLKGRQDAGFPFRNRIQGNGKQGVLDKGIFKTFIDGLGKGDGLFFRQMDGRYDFIEDRLVQGFADNRVFHALADIVEAGQIGTEDHRRMSAVEDTDFLFLEGWMLSVIRIIVYLLEFKGRREAGQGHR
mgnify:CR=1 FL=1